MRPAVRNFALAFVALLALLSFWVAGQPGPTESTAVTTTVTPSPTTTAPSQGGLSVEQASVFMAAFQENLSYDVAPDSDAIEAKWKSPTPEQVDELLAKAQTWCRVAAETQDVNQAWHAIGSPDVAETPAESEAMTIAISVAAAAVELHSVCPELSALYNS